MRGGRTRNKRVQLVATKKPRITVTLDPNVHETIRRYALMLRWAGDGSASMSSVIGDLLNEIHGPLMRTVALLEAAQEAPKKVQMEMASSIALGLEGLQDVSGGTLKQLDFVLRQASERASAASRVSERSADSRSGPPRSNTGVRSPKPPPRNRSSGS